MNEKNTAPKMGEEITRRKLLVNTGLTVLTVLAVTSMLGGIYLLETSLTVEKLRLAIEEYDKKIKKLEDDLKQTLAKKERLLEDFKAVAFSSHERMKIALKFDKVQREISWLSGELFDNNKQHEKLASLLKAKLASSDNK
jgi:hypothetical protein